MVGTYAARRWYTRTEVGKMEPLEKARDGRYNRRTKVLDVSPGDGDRWRFRSGLVDESYGGNYVPEADHIVVHDFAIEGTLEGPDLILTTLNVAANEHPFAECPFALGTAQQLIGRSLTVGWRKTVLSHLAGVQGCTHVTTLLLGLSEVTTLIYFQRMNSEAVYGAEARTSGAWIGGSLEIAPKLSGACHALRADGPVIDRAEKYRPH